jgi:two-component sensor histidine kinase
VVGSAAILGKDGVAERRKLQVTVALRGPDGPQRFAVRVEPRGSDRFKELSDRIRNLDSEVSRRRQAQARLETALRDTELLYTELQHRVNNNLQLMLALFAAARRDAADGDGASALDHLESKIAAAAAAQRLMYAAPDLMHVQSNALASSLVAQYIDHPLARQGRLTLEGDDFRIPNDFAFPFALILNELLRSALHGGAFIESKSVRVELRTGQGRNTLAVTGVDVDRDSAYSGRGLVQGLCRQLGGDLVVERFDPVDAGVRIGFPIW